MLIINLISYIDFGPYLFRLCLYSSYRLYYDNYIYEDLDGTEDQEFNK